MRPVLKLSSPPPLAPSAKRAGCMPAFLLLMTWSCLPRAQAQQAPPAEPKPEPVRTTITVVEKIAAETPASVTVLSNETLEQTPGTNLDDRLRDVPGFSLFRRSSSLV